jgi:hypothetical protein
VIVYGLWILLGLFLLRVAGQFLVLIARPFWLPPMKDWYSGLIPYRILLPTQLAILVLMFSIALGVTSESGWFGQQRHALGVGVLCFSLLYALSMVIRLVIRIRRHPDLRWYEGGMIPTIFHFVLSGFLFLLARWHLA